MAHGPIPDKPVSMEEFLAESLKLKDGSPYQPTETQLLFLSQAARKGQRLLREDAEAMNASARRLYRS
jgi:hypothetical protein